MNDPFEKPTTSAPDYAKKKNTTQKSNLKFFIFIASFIILILKKYNLYFIQI
jgi:hypothetical protein